MSRAEHTYTAGDIAVHLIVPDGIGVPPTIRLKRESDGALGTFQHVGVRNLRAPTKRKPRAESASMIPDDWEPPADEVERLRAECPSVEFGYELAQMRDYFRGRGQPMKDHVAVWRGWIRRSHRRNVERGWKATAAPTREEDPRTRWIRDHGLTEDEYEANKDDPEWVERIKRRGKMR